MVSHEGQWLKAIERRLNVLLDIIDCLPLFTGLRACLVCKRSLVQFPPFRFLH